MKLRSRPTTFTITTGCSVACIATALINVYIVFQVRRQFNYLKSSRSKDNYLQGLILIALIQHNLPYLRCRLSGCCESSNTSDFPFPKFHQELYTYIAHTLFRKDLPTWLVSRLSIFTQPAHHHHVFTCAWRPTLCLSLSFCFVAVQETI